MGMIRRADIEQAARGGIVMNLGDLAREGDRILAAAKEEAERIIAEANAERQRLLKGAVEEGRAEGLARGLAEGREKGAAEGAKRAIDERAKALAAIEKGWTEALEQVEQSRTEMLAALRRDGLALAVGIAERVIRASVAHDPATTLRSLEAALALLARPTRLVVTINPEDEALIREALPALMTRFRDATHAEIVADPAIERGGCILGTDAGGTIDATIRTQIERVASSLLGDDAVAPDTVQPVPADAATTPAPVHKRSAA